MAIPAAMSSMRPAQPGPMWVDPFVPLLVVFVGLPGRGKSELARRLTKKLNWSGEKAKLFDSSEYRRMLMGAYEGHDLFSSENPEGIAIRVRSERKAVEDATVWMTKENGIAVVDGSNIMRQRRCSLSDNVAFRTLFVECICGEDKFLQQNFLNIARYSDDYKGMPLEKALDELTIKVRHLERQYEPIDYQLEQISFLKLNMYNDTLMLHRMAGRRESLVLRFLSVIKPMPQFLYLSRHGESEDNVLQRLGGDSELTPRGERYATALSKYFNEKACNDPVKVWSSELIRAKQTGRNIAGPKLSLMALNELSTGIFSGLTYDDIRRHFPLDSFRRDKCKLTYRYPQGESYADVMVRLAPVLEALENEPGTLVISHQAVMRCLLGYFLDTKQADIPHLEVPQHVLIKLTARGYRYDMEMIRVEECEQGNALAVNALGS